MAKLTIAKALKMLKKEYDLHNYNICFSCRNYPLTIEKDTYACKGCGAGGGIKPMFT